MNGLPAGVVKTSAAKRAPGFSARRIASKAVPGDGKSISPIRQIDVEARLLLRQILRRAFECLDILETCMGGILANMFQHGGRYVAGHYAAVRTDPLCSLNALAAGTAGDIENAHAPPETGHIHERFSRFGQAGGEDMLPLRPAGRRQLPRIADFRFQCLVGHLRSSGAAACKEAV